VAREIDSSNSFNDAALALVVHSQEGKQKDQGNARNSKVNVENPTPTCVLWTSQYF
jgi:hypothetical protein